MDFKKRMEKEQKIKFLPPKITLPRAKMQEALLKHIKDHEQKNKELKKILMQVKEEIHKGVAQIS